MCVFYCVCVCVCGEGCIYVSCGFHCVCKCKFVCMCEGNDKKKTERGEKYI